MMMDCDDTTFETFNRLASVPMDDLHFGDLMMLTGHDGCCGERLRAEKIPLDINDNLS